MNDTYVLYRFFTGDGRLLYVGMTRNPARRFEQHGGTKSWWSEVERIEMEHHATLDALREAERRAIESDHPIHNIRMNGGTKREPHQVSGHCGLEKGRVYAIGLDDSTCPVGIVDSLDGDGFTLTLYSWLYGMFDGPDRWFPYDSICRWERAEKMSRSAVEAEGWNMDIVKEVFAMDPLAHFQTAWTETVSEKTEAPHGVA